MKRVVLITTSFPESVPGSEAAGGFVSDFAKALAQRIAVQVVAPGRRTARRVEEGMTLQRYRAPIQPLSLLSPANPAHWSAICTTLRSGHRALGAALEETRADHMLALWALPSGHWARAWARRSGVPYSVWALGSDIWTLGRVPIVRTVLRSVLHEAAHRFADGFELAQDVREISGQSCGFLASARRFPAVNGVEQKRGPPFRLAFLGRWHRNKGTDLLLEALGRLPEEAWSRIDSVRIAGGGPLEPEIRAAAESLRTRGRPVKLEGYKDPFEAANLFAWSDFVLIPSRTESIPVVFSDALQAERPVIATPVGDLPRLVADGAAGILAAEATSAAFSEAIGIAVSGSGFERGPAFEALRRQFDVNTIAEEFLQQTGLT